MTHDNSTFVKKLTFTLQVRKSRRILIAAAFIAALLAVALPGFHDRARSRSAISGSYSVKKLDQK